MSSWKNEWEIGKRSAPNVFPHEGMSIMYSKVESWWRSMMDENQNNKEVKITNFFEFAKDIKLLHDIKEVSDLFLAVTGWKPPYIGLITKQHFIELWVKSILKSAIINVLSLTKSSNVVNNSKSIKCKLLDYQRQLLVNGVKNKSALGLDCWKLLNNLLDSKKHIWTE